MTRKIRALLLCSCLACNGGSTASGSDTTATTSDPGDTGSTGDAPPVTTGETPTSTGGVDGSDSDSATTGPAMTTTGATGTDASTTTGDSSSSGDTTTAGDSSTGAPVDPCDPDPCAAPQRCEDGVCLDPGKPGPGQVIVTEMMIDPHLTDYDAEWFELLNVGDQHFDLNGCHLADLGVNMNDHPIAAGGPLTIAPGQYLVMAKTVDAAANGGVADVAYAFAQEFSLTNTGDAFVLRCDDLDVDTVEYEPMTWPYATGVGMQLAPDHLDAADNDDPASWCAAADEYHPMHTGSPGLANPPCG
ncbi:MAG: lamin tail domain-containing protein [Myxococcales bacterium]|nr:lamin tail domain-containing protein [Myxococcales bacterium]